MISAKVLVHDAQIMAEEAKQNPTDEQALRKYVQQASLMWERQGHVTETGLQRELEIKHAIKQALLAKQPPAEPEVDDTVKMDLRQMTGS